MLLATALLATATLEAGARLLVADPAELVVDGMLDVWRIAREAELLNSTLVPSDDCPGS
jgi:hypothetical protein